MAGRKLRARSLGAIARARPVLRIAGRALTAAGLLLIATLVVVQFARAINENLRAARQLSQIRSDIAELTRERDEEERELRRLRDPQGVIPEIHDRLRLVRPNEVLIFVSPAPSPPP